MHSFLGLMRFNGRSKTGSETKERQDQDEIVEP
jgi:hypothetical protein